jgi:hypothetical protein
VFKTPEYPRNPTPVGSITATLWEMGVTHKRDQWSHADSYHAFYFAGRMIGRYSAYQVALLLEEHGLCTSDVIHEENNDG